MPIQLQLGLDVIRSYRRLSYTPWHALAEFVDNSTQSYFENREALDVAHAARNEKFEVSLVYERDANLIRIADNAMGMSYDELQRALHVGLRPINTSGRSKYGMGMKTAACWLGNRWTVKTKKLGETVEHSVTVVVDDVAEGNADLPEGTKTKTDPNQSYTIVEIRDLNTKFHPKTVHKIKNFLASMYREDLLADLITLKWQDTPLKWEGYAKKLLVAKDGTKYFKEFEYDVNGKKVYGWVGILARGSRAEAGFSILHANRVVRGWPDSWRPESLYGQILGSNDLVNQRLVGEIHLDDFEVSHTKDDILWMGDEQYEVERQLKEHANDFRNFAKTWRPRSGERGPTDADIAAAVDEFKRELESSQMADLIQLETVPPPEAVEAATKSVVQAVATRNASFDVKIGDDLEIRVYLEDRSANDPYVVNETAHADRVIVIVNTAHPHVATIEGSHGFLNYLRHSVYDAVAEWQASRKATPLNPDTVKWLKDRLLRLSFELETTDVPDEAVG